MFKFRQLILADGNRFPRVLNTLLKQEQCQPLLSSYHNHGHEGTEHKCFSRLCSKTNSIDEDSFMNQRRKDRERMILPVRNCHVHVKPNADTKFGSLNRYTNQNVEMDEEELKEEEYHRTKPRKTRKENYLGKHIKEISAHIKDKNVISAIEALKGQGSQANRLNYNRVLRELSRSGEMEQCFKLFKKMKDIGIEPNHATYTTLINSCAESSSPKALEKLDRLRQMLYEKQFVLNDTNYNAMIKAYGRHGKLKEAFQIVDEMCDKRLNVGHYTYSFLLQAAISDKESGLKVALNVWHLMRYSRIKPLKCHYDLLLRAIRDTNIGKCTVGDSFVSNNESAKLTYIESGVPNLLQSPPTVSGLLLPLIRNDSSKKKDIQTEIAMTNAQISQAISLVENNLDNVLKKNKLLLFGGFENILKEMEADNVTPDIATMTLILDMLPSSSSEEHKLMKYMSEKNITPDTGFYNMLMRKHTFKFDYKGARNVLVLMQKANVRPDITTFQILAMGCHTKHQAQELLTGLSSMQYAPSACIVGVLIKNLARNFDLNYLNYILKYIQLRKIQINDDTLAELKALVRNLQEDKATTHPAVYKPAKITIKKRRLALQFIKEFLNSI